VRVLALGRSLESSPTAALTRDHARSFWLASTLAAAAIALIPLWYHVVLVESGVQGIIAVFSEVGVYPSDGCLAVLGLMAIAHPVALDSRSRWLGVGLSLLAAVALLSARQSRDQVLTSGLSGQLAILALAWFGSRSLQVSRTVLVAALVASAVVQSALAAGQFLFQQPLVAPELQLPWLPGDVSEGGTPVILNSAGERLLRGFGTFPHPNVLGGYLAMALVCLPVLGVRWPRRAALWWLLGAAISIGLLASFSRAGWLAAVVGLSVSCWPAVRQRHARWWIAPIAAVAVLSAIALSPIAPTIAERLSPLGADTNALERGSIENRLALDRSALVEIGDHLPLGVGGANYGLVAVAEGYQEGWGEPVPNLVLLITAELGLPGVLALLLVVVGCVRLLAVGRTRDLPVAAAFFALIVLAMLDHYLWTMPLGRIIAWIPFALIAPRIER